VLFIEMVQCFVKHCMYRLDGMMTGLPPSVCSEENSSCHLTDLNRVILQLHACIAWES